MEVSAEHGPANCWPYFLLYHNQWSTNILDEIWEKFTFFRRQNVLSFDLFVPYHVHLLTFVCCQNSTFKWSILQFSSHTDVNSCTWITLFTAINIDGSASTTKSINTVYLANITTKKMGNTHSILTLNKMSRTISLSNSPVHNDSTTSIDTLLTCAEVAATSSRNSAQTSGRKIIMWAAWGITLSLLASVCRSSFPGGDHSFI